MNSRRHFHKQLGCIIGGTLATCKFAPHAFATDGSSNSRRIVTVFLNGGNDGLNTVIPATDPRYHQYRRDLRINSADAIRLQRDMFLHPALRDLSEIWNAGRLNIRQGVGYPNHSRSHFESIAVWSEGRLDANSPSFDGWLARALDTRQRQSDSPLACAVDSVETPELLRGRFTRTTTLPQIPTSEANAIADLLASDRSTQSDNASAEGNDLRRLVEHACRDAADTLAKYSRSADRLDGFPQNAFGRRMRQVATVIETMPEIKAIHVAQDGYDTHSTQRVRHRGLLLELAAGLRALDLHLHQRGLSDSVLVMVFSEFGRRVAENASAGTDHGAAGPVCLIGGGQPGGLFGEVPDLEKLDDGDIAVTSDLRDLYAELVPWLTQDS